MNIPVSRLFPVFLVFPVFLFFQSSAFAESSPPCPGWPFQERHPPPAEP